MHYIIKNHHRTWIITNIDGSAVKACSVHVTVHWTAVWSCDDHVTPLVTAGRAQLSRVYHWTLKLYLSRLHLLLRARWRYWLTILYAGGDKRLWSARRVCVCVCVSVTQYALVCRWSQVVLSLVWRTSTLPQGVSTRPSVTILPLSATTALTAQLYTSSRL